MAFADHFSSVARDYAAFRPHYPPALAAALAARAPAGTAWDVGCGSGQFSVALADHVARVIATDPAQAQIAEGVPHPRVAYRVAPAEASGLADQSVTLVVAAQAAHWFAWPKFVAEVERVAVPGALLALVSYGIDLVEGDAANAIVQRYYHEDVGAFWPAGRAHVENGYRDLVWPWPAVEAPAMDMTAVWTRDELLGYIGTWSATVKRAATDDGAAYAALRTQLAAVWPDAERRTITWPLAIRLARR